MVLDRQWVELNVQNCAFIQMLARKGRHQDLQRFIEILKEPKDSMQTLEAQLQKLIELKSKISRSSNGQRDDQLEYVQKVQDFLEDKLLKMYGCESHDRAARGAADEFEKRIPKFMLIWIFENWVQI